MVLKVTWNQLKKWDSYLLRAAKIVLVTDGELNGKQEEANHEFKLYAKKKYYFSIKLSQLLKFLSHLLKKNLG